MGDEIDIENNLPVYNCLSLKVNSGDMENLLAWISGFSFKCILTLKEHLDIHIIQKEDRLSIFTTSQKEFMIY